MGYMANLLILSIVVITAQAKPAPESYAEGYEYHPEYQNYYVSPVIASALPAPQHSQHHAQDELGQYEYGFNTGNQAKHELKTADGITRGSYSYVDANGILQTTNYISDDVFGFRVAATNLPQHVIPAAHAPVAPVHVEPVDFVTHVQNTAPVAVGNYADLLPAAPATVVPAPAPHGYAPTVAYSHLPYALNYGYSAALPQLPQVVANYAAPSLPVVPHPLQTPVHVATPNFLPAPAPTTQTVVLTPAVPTTHQFHAQDELGQYQFGYTEPQSSRIETKTADGVVTGRYNYIDSNGIVQTVEYIADHLGFRVAGTNIPQHVVAAPVAAAAPVQDLPEVIAAREAHLQLVQEARAALPVVVAQPQIVAVPNIVPEVIPEYDTVVDTPVVKVEPKILEPYVPPPVATFYKPADPVKVAAAVEQQLGGLEVPAHIGNVIVPTPLAQLSYTVGQAVPVVSPVASVPVAFAQPQVYVAQPQVAVSTPPVVYHQAPVVPAAGFVPYANQHHAQDEYGQYQYGYTNEDSTKLEERLADGSVRGTYSYIDANGVVQRVDYISDALGFRVAATNLPVHAPCLEGEDCSVLPAPATHVVAHAPVTPFVAPVPAAAHNVYTQVHPAVQQVNVAPNVAPIPYYINPAHVGVTPAVQQVPYASQYGYQQIQYVPSAPTTSQHHAQSELGEFNYGYSNEHSAKTETKTIDGVTRGSYSYVDANNIVQRVDYIADDVFGFRVAATNLPVAPVAAPVPVAALSVLPEVVAPEVDSAVVIEE